MLSQYLTACARHVAKKSFSLGETISGLLSSTIPIIAHFMPVWQSTFDKVSWQIPIFGLAGAIAFRIVTAPYNAWKDQRHGADSLGSIIHDLSDQVMTLKRESSKLSVSVESANWGEKSDKAVSKALTTIVMQVKVSNIGKLPSAATDWCCFLQHETIGFEQVQIVYYHGKVVLDNKGVIITFEEDDAIIVSGEKPITPGEIRRGYVMVEIGYPSELVESKPCKLVLQCSDVLGVTSSFDVHLDWVRDRPMQYIPGTRMTNVSGDMSR